MGSPMRSKLELVPKLHEESAATHARPASAPERVLFLVPAESDDKHSGAMPRALGRIRSAGYRLLKQSLDLVLGSILLCCSLPVIIAAAIAIRVESRGNPFFIQPRLGLNGKMFGIFKLRSMYIDARERFPEVGDFGKDFIKHGGLDFHVHRDRDPRITRVGSFIRKTSIDELPNFLNVVLGSMSLVGPRPETSDLAVLYGDCLDKYLSVKPGVTCKSKVSGRDRLTKEETIRIDLAYIENRSTVTDLKILWETFWCVLWCRNVVGENPVIAHKPHTDELNESAQLCIANADKQA
ncbi:MAG: sugar transferase [Sideroxyarcus sp.]|nr:sugar transferase [Sideroxyarcus sp.]